MAVEQNGEEKDLKYKVLFVASPLVALSLWELAVRTAMLDRRFFPPPTEILAELVRLFREENLIKDIASSMRRIGSGLLLGFAPGVALGMAMGLWAWVRAIFAPLVAITYPIPKIAILPLLLIIFGLGELSNVMVVTIGVFFLALINTYEGVRQIPKIHFEVARVYRIRKRHIFLRIVLPATLPAIFTGLKLSVGYGLILIVAAEMVAANSGIGYRIWMSWETYVIRSLYACLAMISFIGIALAIILEKLEERIVHWKRG